MKIGKLNLAAILLVALPLQLSAQRLIEDEELLEMNSNWDYLYYSDSETNVPDDPAVANPLFHSTWHTPTAYSGTPAFLNGPAMLGWGEVPNGVDNLIMTNIWGSRDGFDVPPSGNRFTCYLRTTFTPTAQVDAIRFDARIDDGAIFYLNGTEVGRINVVGDATSDPDEWPLTADGTGSETANVVGDFTLLTPLPAGVAVDVAVSLHNTSGTSSDIGFDTRIAALIPAPPEPAPNDDFADAEALVDPIPFAATGRSHDTVGGSGATKEASEPNHAGDAGGASVWYSWTAADTARVSIDTTGSDFDTLLAVYTGGTVATLTEVASSDDATFYRDSRVEFDALSGTTYLIAVDGNAGAFGDITLNFAASPAPFEEDELLLAAGSNWDYLMANNTVRPVDPDAQDPDGDFYSTWQTTADYDGPAFQNGPALFGYGVIDADPIVTMIFEAEADGQSNAALFLRNTFTPANPVTNLAFRGLIDDGAIIYIDGVEVARMNVSPAGNANSFRTTALGSGHNGNINNEAFPQVAIAAIELPAGTPVQLAVSVHNASANSSDLGFDMEVYSTSTPPPPLEFRAFIATTATAGEYEISWLSQTGATYNVQYSPDLTVWTDVETGIVGGVTGTDMTLVTPPAGSRAYYRVIRP